MSKKWRLALLIHGLSCLSAVLCYGQTSQQFQNGSSITGAAEQAVFEQLADDAYTNVKIEARPIDSRLRLANCAEPLAATVTNPSQRLGRLTAEVRCNGDSPWKIYVQVMATAELEVPVLSRALPRGTIITNDDVILKSISVGQQQSQVVESADHLIGMELKRAAQANLPISISHIAPPQLVKRGQQVSIRYAESDVQISVAGKAMENGARGDWIAVQNISSGRRVEGRVNNDGSVSIPGY